MLRQSSKFINLGNTSQGNLDTALSFSKIHEVYLTIYLILNTILYSIYKGVAREVARGECPPSDQNIK